MTQNTWSLMQNTGKWGDNCSFCENLKALHEVWWNGEWIPRHESSEQQHTVSRIKQWLKSFRPSHKALQFYLSVYSQSTVPTWPPPDELYTRFLLLSSNCVQCSHQRNYLWGTKYLLSCDFLIHIKFWSVRFENKVYKPKGNRSHKGIERTWYWRKPLIQDL